MNSIYYQVLVIINEYQLITNSAESLLVIINISSNRQKLLAIARNFYYSYLPPYSPFLGEGPLLTWGGGYAVFFSGSWGPTCGTQEIREDDHGVATAGIIRPGPEVCDRPSLESRCLALVRTCTLSLASAASATVPGRLRSEALLR